jgi:predicted Zn-dependent protease
MMEEYFRDIAAIVSSLVRGDEVELTSFQGEDSDFVRWNGGRVRQAGTVAMRSVTIDLISGRRHSEGTVSLSGDRDVDRQRIVRLVESLREQRGVLPEDPFLSYATEPHSTERREQNRLPSRDEALDDIYAAARGRDLVGIYAAGGVYRGFANSLGQTNWYENWSYNFDWSFVRETDKAVTSNYAGFEWNRPAFENKVAAASEQLALLGEGARTIRPGRYAVYLAPAALAELLGLLTWGGFGLRAHRTKTTPLLRMIEDGAHLDSAVTLVENTRDGLAPGFQEEGFLRPDRIPLIERGAYRDCLTSPRSGVEYGAVTNGASEHEMPQSLELAAGPLPAERVLERMGSGIWISNLWYLNYSDRVACRTTGMTRFATFWVENGRLAAPLSVMRFDETVYRMLGENLLALTSEREWLLDPTTYGQRSTTTTRLPGALIRDFTLTL